MVYYLSWKSGEMPCLPSDWEKYLPAYRIEKARAYKQEKDRAASVLAFLLLRYALYKEYARTAMPQIEIDENGKPFDVCRMFRFNLSHCDTAVACAVDAASIGVDVQHFTPVRENVVKKVCSLSEQLRLAQSGFDETLFAAFWSAKEAYGKYTGEGIGYALQAFDFCPDSHFPQESCLDGVRICTSLHDSFALSVCSSQKQDFLPVSYDQLRTFCAVLTNAL